MDLPLFVVYVLNNPGFYERLIERPLKTKETIPPKFCCFCVSNGGCFVRNKMFEIISSYKKVDSFGNHNNNLGYKTTIGAAETANIFNTTTATTNGTCRIIKTSNNSAFIISVVPTTAFNTSTMNLIGQTNTEYTI